MVAARAGALCLTRPHSTIACGRVPKTHCAQSWNTCSSLLSGLDQAGAFGQAILRYHASLQASGVLNVLPGTCRALRSHVSKRSAPWCTTLRRAWVSDQRLQGVCRSAAPCMLHDNNAHDMGLMALLVVPLMLQPTFMVLQPTHTWQCCTTVWWMLRKRLAFVTH
jgi:hypothetical protein